MLPINQQNLAFLSISSNNVIENNNLEIKSDSFPGFENLFSAYNTPLQDENIAALVHSDLPLSVLSNDQVQAEEVTFSTNFFSSASLLSPDISSSIDDSQIKNISPPSVLQNIASVEEITFSDVSMPDENNINSYLIGGVTSSTNIQQSNGVETTPQNRPLQLNTDQSTDADLAAFNDNVNTSAFPQHASQIIRSSPDSANPSLKQPSNNSLPSLSESQAPVDIETTSIEQINTVNIGDEKNNSNKDVAHNNDREVPLSIKPVDIATTVTPLADPVITNIAASGQITIQNTKINPAQNTQASYAKVTHPATKIESESLSNQSEQTRPVSLKEQHAQAESSNINYFNRNNAQTSSIEIAADDTSFSPSPVGDNQEAVLEQKSIPMTSSFVQQGDDNLQQTPNQPLLSINKMTGLTSYSADLTSATDITNSSEIVKQLVLAQQNGNQQIRLLITPEHLGAVDISIQEAKEGVNIQIVTHNLATKESLEAFMPRLREMLEQSGVNIQDTSIEHKQQNSDSSFGTDYQQANHDENKSGQRDSTDIREQSHTANNIPISDHILDAFA